MNPALLFLFRRMAVTAIRERIRRLKQPRYLLFALLGGLYFLFLCGTQIFTHDAARNSSEGVPPVLVEWSVTLLLLLFSATAWLLPSKAPGLPFTEIEVALLFPAPLSRRDLIRWKVLDLQKALLFSAAIIAVFTGLRSGVGRALGVFVGAGVVLNCLALHHAGAKFALASAAAHGRRGLGLLARAALAFAAAVGACVYFAPPIPAFMQMKSGEVLKAATDWLLRLSESPVGWILLPYRVLARIGLSTDPAEFALWLTAGLALLWLLLRWVVRSDAAFEEAAAAHASDLARKLEAIRAGRPLSSVEEGGKSRTRRSTFRLAPTGSPEGAFAWRSFASALQGMNPRFLGILVAVVVLGLTFGSRAFRGAPTADLVMGILAFASFATAGLASFLAPGHVGASLRQDLDRIELLKALPLSGRTVVRSLVVAASAPAIAVVACGIVLGAVLLPDQAKFPMDMPLRVSGAAAALLGFSVLAVLAGALDTAAVLFFPAWLRQSPAAAAAGGGGGVEAMGSQMVQGLVRWLGLVLLLIVPGAVGAAAGIGVAFVLPAGGRGPAILLGTAVGGAVALAEVWLLTILLAPRWDRLDPSDEGIGR